MARIYETFKIIDYDEVKGEIVLEWQDTNDLTNTFTLNHRIPLEAEDANWTEAQYRSYFINEVSDAATIPDWMKTEARDEMLTRKGMSDLPVTAP